MLYLIATILLNVLIFVLFRIFPKYKIDNIQAIVTNYWVCVIIAFVMLKDQSMLNYINVEHLWVKLSLVLGVLFIFTFLLMAITTQKLSVTIGTVSAKMSLVFPVAFSLFLFNVQYKSYDLFNYLGIAVALTSIFLTTLKKEKLNTKDLPKAMVFVLPFLVFVFSGLIDTLINFNTLNFSNEIEEALFPFLIFFSAAFIGLIVLMYRMNIHNEQPQLKSIVAGVILGIPNFFSIYYLVKALAEFKNDGAVLYPILNTGIILLATLVSVIFFKEKLSGLNKVGIIMAILALILISWQELAAFTSGII